jgi:hypothetical protein
LLRSLPPWHACRPSELESNTALSASDRDLARTQHKTAGMTHIAKAREIYLQIWHQGTLMRLPKHGCNNLLGIWVGPAKMADMGLQT